MTDADQADDELVFETTVIPTNGNLTLSSSPLSVGETFTQQDIIDGNIDYDHDAGETTSDSFSFTVTDGNTTLPAETFDITVNPVDDPPTLDLNSGLNLDEEATVTIDNSFLSASDVDNTDDEILYQIINTPAQWRKFN